MFPALSKAVHKIMEEFKTGCVSKVKDKLLTLSNWHKDKEDLFATFVEGSNKMMDLNRKLTNDGLHNSEF